MRKTFSLLLLLLLLSDIAFALDKVVLQLRWDHQFQFAGYYAAEMQGYYRETGLDVEIRGAISSGQQLKQATEEVTSGRADFGIGAADIIIANERGADLKVVAGVMQRSSSRFYLLEKHGQVSLRELAENLRVARVVNGLVDVELQAMLRSQGIDPTEVEPYRFEPGLDYFIAGDVDVIPGYSLGFPFDAEKLGLSYLSINPAQYDIDFCGDSLFSRGDLIRQHPQMVADFVSASMQGWIYALQNPEKVIAYIEKNYKRVFHRENLTNFNRFQAEQLPVLMESDIVAPGYINSVNWRKMHKALQEAGLVDSSFEELDLLWSPKEALPKLRQERLLLNLYLALSVLLTMLLSLIVLYIFKERHRKDLIHSRRNYQKLFDQTLVSIWSEDFCEVILYLEDLRQSGVSDLRAYLQEYPAEVFEIGSKVKVTNLNDVTFDMFRIENRDISTISFADYIPESAIDVLIDFIVSIWEGKTRFESETTYRRGDGSEFPALVAIQLPSDKNDLKNVPVSIVDITERKRAEEENKSLTQRLLLATSSGRLGVWDWNVRENTMIWDNRMFELYGVTREETPSNIDAWLNGLHPEDKETAIANSQAALDGEKDYDTEFRVLHPDGTVKHLKANGLVILGSDGKPDRMLGINMDITEEKQAEIEKAKLEQQLQQSQKIESIGQLAGGVAHDFNNMLGVILGHTELALMKAHPDNPFVKDLEQIQTAAKRSANLTRQLLTFARKETIAPQVLDLNETVAEMLTMLQRLIGENIQLSWNPDPDLWSINLDPTQLNQILANLCVNARDAIDGIGTITMTSHNCSIAEGVLEADCEVQPGDYVLLSISDDGHGINQDDLQKIFEPFFTTKEFGQGTGLGLSTVYGAVKQNHGYIDVASELGQGTTFHIYLPRQQADVESDEETAPPQPLGQGEGTVLVVEDDQMLLDLTKTMLEESGYTVLDALNINTAISFAKEHSGPIDLLLSDLIMPEMNGKDLRDILQVIRPEMKVIFMSGYTDDIIAKQGVIDEGVHFLQKPVSFDVLTAKVSEVLDAAS